MAKITPKGTALKIITPKVVSQDAPSSSAAEEKQYLIKKPAALGLHPRNRHPGRYDFDRLRKCVPELTPFVAKNKFGEESIDFADPAAVKTLNQALLNDFYGISHWDLPPGYLCPPIPGRADYIHHVADLLAIGRSSGVPRGKGVRVLDVGVGSSCIYPLIGNREYGWSFVGSEVDPVSIESARKILAANSLEDSIELREQSSGFDIFEGVVQADEYFDLCICNPPFHASLEEARAGSRRKWTNLRQEKARKNEVLNFGGQESELWCKGGERAFIKQMIHESAAVAKRFFWFSTLVSKGDNLLGIYEQLRRVSPFDVKTIEMSHGNKKSRIVAWTFLDSAQQAKWRSRKN